MLLTCYRHLPKFESAIDKFERSVVENRNKRKGAQSKTNVDTDVQVSSYLKTANADIIMKRFVWFVKKW